MKIGTIFLFKKKLHVAKCLDEDTNKRTGETPRDSQLSIKIHLFMMQNDRHTLHPQPTTPNKCVHLSIHACGDRGGGRASHLLEAVVVEFAVVDGELDGGSGGQAVRVHEHSGHVVGEGG